MKQNTNKHGHTSSELREAADRIRDLDALDLVGEFRSYLHTCTPGTYAAMILRPGDGETYCINEPSCCCSTEEYFGERGLMSRETILSDTRDHWSPSPDDGFEWSDGDDYWGQDGDWFVADQAEERAQKFFDGMTFEQAEGFVGKGVEMEGGELFLRDESAFLRALGWETFSVSDTPVDGWVPQGWRDYQVEELQRRLNELVDGLEMEADELESEE